MKRKRRTRKNVMIGSIRKINLKKMMNNKTKGTQ